ncbi:TrmB family transcriptional regulator sugar-binding domain-containing protein [Kitasatospora sp. MBT66]|uniref:TrmB family transcriptional regulator sugar-binding domain-containing protein n=1 Tax=Kitasatospora sp. MBT66 TaxID=1444769 RepID=UPI00068AC21F|nr:TrmB family transcriptional regulator sugar-binding domain-containing protein [Kitasatospora sp. MBT66]
MPNTVAGRFEPTSLSEEARGLYIAIRHGVVVDDPESPVLRELLDFGLVAPYPVGRGEAGRYIALNPMEVGTQKRDRLYRQISQAMSEAAALPETVRDLAIVYQYSDPNLVEGAVEKVEGMDRINSRLSEIISAATHELLTAQPGGPRPADVLKLALHRDVGALQRGVAMRTLYKMSARSDQPTAQWVADITAAGGNVRTLAEDFMRMVVVDRQTAVLTDHTPWTGPGAEPLRALIVHDEGLVHYVARMFDRDWSRAAIWRGEEAPESAGLTELQRSIVQRLATGADQVGAAKELGISPRTVSAQLAEMRLALGYCSTAQLMFELGRQAGREDSYSAG